MQINIARDMLERISQKAAADEIFRKNLINNPRKALESEFNLKLPQNTRVAIHEVNENILNIIIPV